MAGIMKKIFVFGNPLVKEDSIALLAAKELEKKFSNFEFEQIESLNDLPEIPKELVILDCAEGIEKIEILHDLKKLRGEKKVSLHDFDLATELLLLEKIGKLKGKKICVIAIPKKMPLKKAVNACAILLSKSVLNRKCRGHKP
jgi:Ni,Fe-hydrogenase maturation factor